MKLQERLDAYKADFQNKAPAEAIEIMHRVTENLRNAGIVERAISVGDKAPPFTLNDKHGDPLSLDDLLRKGPVVIGFYRGRW